MKNHFYFEVMRRTIIQFLDLFNDLRIARYDLDTGKLLKYISVPMKFAPKMKYWWWKDNTDSQGNKQFEIVMPIIGIKLTDVSFASDRLTNKHAKVRQERVLQNVKHNRFKNPVPFNFKFDVMIAAQYIIDITQILEQILPFFDPTAYIRITIPEVTIDHKEGDADEGAYPIDLKIIYEGSSQDMTPDIGEDEYRGILWTLSFKVEGYLFKPAMEDPIIHKAFIEYYVRQTVFPDNPNVTTTLTGLSAEKWPRDVTTEELSGSLYDESIKLLYKYEREGD